MMGTQPLKRSGVWSLCQQQPINGHWPSFCKWQRSTSLGGLEPPTFRLTAERANPIAPQRLVTSLLHHQTNRNGHQFFEREILKPNSRFHDFMMWLSLKWKLSLCMGLEEKSEIEDYWAGLGRWCHNNQIRWQIYFHSKFWFILKIFLIYSMSLSQTTLKL